MRSYASIDMQVTLYLQVTRSQEIHARPPIVLGIHQPRADRLPLVLPGHHLVPSTRPRCPRAGLGPAPDQATEIPRVSPRPRWSKPVRRTAWVRMVWVGERPWR